MYIELIPQVLPRQRQYERLHLDSVTHQCVLIKVSVRQYLVLRMASYTSGGWWLGGGGGGAKKVGRGKKGKRGDDEAGRRGRGEGEGWEKMVRNGGGREEQAGG